MMDDPAFHVEVMTLNPSKPVRLPPADSERRRFISEFYSWRMTKDPNIVIMVVSKSKGDLLYIDRNINNDLTDDGPPMFFPFDQDTLTFEIAPSYDSKQRVRLLLARKLNYSKTLHDVPDSLRKNDVDELGNLKPTRAKLWGSFSGEPDFKGTYGSFYFDDRVTLRRGTLALNGKHYSIGLFDFSNNGLYNDSDDVLIVDIHGNGILSYTDQTQVFKLNDVFSLEGRNFTVHNMDKYGMWVDLEETSRATTSYFVQEQDSLQVESAKKNEIDPAIWDVTGTSLDGSSVSLNNYRGKFLLLNFWGEWCKPCIEEIPALDRAWRKYSTLNVQFISFIKTQNIEKAKKLIADSSITWPQLPLSDGLERKLRITGYPTNILIYPNGKDCLVIHSINDVFFERYLH
jgi:thiol-disulfide isomerase/thioredoxin